VLPDNCFHSMHEPEPEPDTHHPFFVLGVHIHVRIQQLSDSANLIGRKDPAQTTSSEL
jgi:hypothetical protein